uniref:Cerato-platanin 4 n=1 Tax=Crinipellis campanella TaxID=34447 RepID=S4UQF2_9AGAR|nr:cerato-platanin 4 [Crinipellis campanella]
MKFTSFAASLALVLLPVHTGAVQLQYDNAYDNAGQSMLTVACSDGANGLASRFPTFGSVPIFPHIGASDAVEGWNSVNCGACFQVTYTNAQGQSKSINVLAIDHAGSGFNVAQAAMDELTGGQAVALGNIDVQSTRVASSACGL